MAEGYLERGLFRPTLPRMHRVADLMAGDLLTVEADTRLTDAVAT